VRGVVPIFTFGHPLLNPQFLAALTLSLAIVTALAAAALREDIAPRPARRWPARLSTIVLSYRRGWHG